MYLSLQTQILIKLREAFGSEQTEVKHENASQVKQVSPGVTNKSSQYDVQVLLSVQVTQELPDEFGSRVLHEMH